MKQIPPEIEGEYIIRVMDMPECLNGMVKYDEDDFANIYVNAKLNTRARQRAADHELTHVINDDIHNSDPIEVIESRADAQATPRRRLPPLFKASDLLQQTPTVAAASTPPRSQTNSTAPKLSPHQTAVLLRAISDLDRFIFSDRPFYEE